MPEAKKGELGYLMCSADHLDVVGLVELSHHVGPEEVAEKKKQRLF